MKAIMIFDYNEIENSFDDFDMSIDDLTMFPPACTVKVNGKDITIGDYDVNDIIHVDFYDCNCKVSNSEIKICATINFIWTDEAGFDMAAMCALDNEYDMIHVIRFGMPNNIVPYTNGTLVKGLQLKSLEFVKDNEIIRKLTEGECLSFDTEQYDKEENYFFNYGSVM